MYSKTWTYTPEDDNLTGFLSNATGATWTLTTTTPGDSLAHFVIITNDSATDHSGKTAALPGTDADGRAQTETLTLPAASVAVTSTKYWKTLTTVFPSATIGADTMDIGWTDDIIGPTIPVNWRSLHFSLTHQVDVSGTINYDLEYTLGGVLGSTAPSTLSWLNHATTVNEATDQSGSDTANITAVRLAINSLTAGATISLYLLQGN